MTRSMYSALTDLQLERLDVVYAGEKTNPLAERVRAVGRACLDPELDPLT